MKRTSLATRNVLLSPRGISVGVVSLVVAVAVLLVRFGFPNVFLTLATPFFSASSWSAAVVDSMSANFTSNAALARANQDLMAQNAALSVENRALLEKDADIAKLVVHATEKGGVAGVLARPPESPYDTLIIAIGAKDGAVVGNEVFGPGGVPIGTIASVTDSFARVLLFSAPGVTTNAWLGSSRIPLTLLGAGGGTFSASVPRTASVNAGDIVFVSGPGALPIGSVVRADGDPASPTLTLHIAPLSNPFSLTWVRVGSAAP